MVAVTIKEARVRLNQLVQRAIAGEDVVLLRGSRHVACLVPITDADLELSPRITDAQAARLWQALSRSRREGRLKSFDSPQAAVAHLRKVRRERRRP